ncbi:MAG: FHA domain-containing protein [Gammaproteobacteria bacterium]|nr:FHA domain-containing protein [Gammaproteobacteria bacterium]NNM21657.1 FHA domain-containing protein [Gammaproteobacteria bacterium]
MTIAIEIGDSGLRVRGAEGVLLDSPGYALVDGDVSVGAAALAQARLHPGRVFDDFWGQLSLDSLPGSVRGAATYADLAYHHLRQVWSETGREEPVILVVPGSYGREQLSLLLGIARECAVPVSAMVDQAVVAAEQPVPGRQLFHLELLARRVVLTELNQGRQLSRGQVSEQEGCGLADFYAAWANAVGDTFVRNTRYDPMHSAESEQRLYDQLPGWLAAVSRAGQAELSLPSGGRDHTVTVSAQSLAAAAQEQFSRLSRHIAATGRPGEPLTLLLSDRIQFFPGLVAALGDNLSGCDVVEQATAQAAAGALRRADEICGSGESVAFVTSVSWHRDAVSLPLPQEERPAEVLPTHVLYRGRGIPIGSDTLTLGSQPTDSGRNVVLTGDLAGVSREHCRITRNDGVVVVEDCSEHGTFVNDRRIDGSVSVNYGDVLRLGGTEQLLQLITVDGA